MPERKGAGIAEHGEIVDGDDDRGGRAQRPAHGRAVENVEITGGAADPERVPDGIAGERRDPAGPAERKLLQLEPGASGQRAQQAAHVAGRARARLRERGHVEADPHCASS